jgi:hypothetical protein
MAARDVIRLALLKLGLVLKKVTEAFKRNFWTPAGFMR